MDDFYCIADEDTVRGFRLAGVEGRVVTSAAEAVEALHRALSSPEHSLIILTQDVAAWLPEQIATCRSTQDRPLLVEIPGPNGPVVGRRTLRQLAQAAVGVCIDHGKRA